MRVRWAFWGILLASVWTLMAVPGGGEWYARHIYPVLSNGLSRFSSLFPFSLGDVFIYGSLGGLIAYAVVCLYRRKGIRKMIRREVEYLAWTYVWFYLAWGLLYYRADFFTRTSLEKQRLQTIGGSLWLEQTRRLPPGETYALFHVDERSRRVGLRRSLLHRI